MFINLSCHHQVPGSRQVILKCERSQKNGQKHNKESWMINSPCTQPVSRGQKHGFGIWKGKTLLRLSQCIVFPEHSPPYIPCKDAEVNVKLWIFPFRHRIIHIFLFSFTILNNFYDLLEKKYWLCLVLISLCELNGMSK